MTILILRHGQAEPRGEGIADSERKLTRKGKRDVHRVMTVARKAGVRIDAVLTSPLRRAVETAALAAQAFERKLAVTETSALLPSGSISMVIKELQAHAEKERILLVGHEPQLSALAAHLLGCSDVRVRLKKGALLRIGVGLKSGESNGELHWVVTPRLARSVAGARRKTKTN